MNKRYQENKEFIDLWKKLNISKFNKNLDRTFLIDTPPPYPSGEFHMGNTLNWCWIDIIARYKRMKGFDVLFPQGWDVHGLPTEVKVEKAHNVKSEEVDRNKWKDMCKEWTEKNIKKMKEDIFNLGVCGDWDYEFRTSDDSYKRLIQLSFLDLYRKSLAYRGKYPINFCTTCRTAIADAEVEYENIDTKLNHVLFKVKDKDKKVEIATTRPELLSSCVAIGVNPEDEKNKELIGKKLIVPIFNKEVKVLGLKEVDPNFGTGIVMICSFGDKQDLEWIMNHNLDIVESIDDHGRMINEKYKGLGVEEAREKIIEDLKKEDKIVRQEQINQSRGTCWRCHKPVEILNREQWFIAVTKYKNKIIEETDKVNWIPEYMKKRQIDWTQNMNRDWCVSRKKVFGTPIPVWYCDNCKKIVVAQEEDLPIDPTISHEKYKTCECGGELMGEKETFDTWVDSSFSVAFVNSYLRNIYNKEKQEFEDFYEADMQPNGFDIIRTWDYYLMVRHLIAFNKKPYKNCLINGMVLGKDGKKMSKSLGNIVTLQGLMEKYCVDTIRYWTCLATPGSNIIPSDQQLKRGSYLLTKFWNSARFCSQFIEEKDVEELETTDKWILSKLSEVLEKIQEFMDNYEIAKAMGELENFFVHDFCDNYLEFIKYRLYQEKNSDAAKSTLNKLIISLTKMFAPFMPFISESIYQELFKDKESVHMENFPESSFYDERNYKVGELLKTIISEIRKWKISKQISLGKKISKVEIGIGEELMENFRLIEEDIKNIGRAKEVEFKEGGFGIKCFN